jgi:hypothetical protein
MRPNRHDDLDAARGIVWGLLLMGSLWILAIGLMTF